MGITQRPWHRQDHQHPRKKMPRVSSSSVSRMKSSVSPKMASPVDIDISTCSLCSYDMDISTCSLCSYDMDISTCSLCSYDMDISTCSLCSYDMDISTCSLCSYDMDNFTKEFYRLKFGLEDFTPIQVTQLSPKAINQVSDSVASQSHQSG